MGEPFFPNLYLLLVGPPAVGKGVAMLAARETVWTDIKEYHVAPKSMTAASLSDALDAAKVKLLRPQSTPPFIEFNSLVINIPELGTLLSQYDRDMIQRLTDVYDAGSWEETRRGAKLHLAIPKAQINLLAACTPSFLGEFLPPGAWDQGFMSRMIMIFAGESSRKNIFETPAKQEALRQALLEDARTIAGLYGKMEWTNSAQNALQSWDIAKGPPTPDHHKLEHYVSRRTGQMLKLSMVASISRSNELIVREEDFDLALSWLVDAEERMPEVFKAMRSSTTDMTAMEETWYHLWQLYSKDTKPIEEGRLLSLLARHLPNYSVPNAVMMMQRLNMINVVGATDRGNVYKPLARGKHDRV